MKKLLIICLSAVSIVGCRSIGPVGIHMDRESYNNIVLQTEREQLLMNIVRLRYLEGSQYTQISAITASYSLNESLSGNVTTSSSPPYILSSLGSSISPSISYSDSPTISYTPLSNSDFTKSLLTPISMTNFLLLSHATNFDYMMLYSIFIEAIGEVNARLLNIKGLNHVTPQYITYNKTLDLMKKLYNRGAFQAPRSISYEHNLGALIRFHKKDSNSPDAIKLKKLLQVPLDTRDLIFMEHTLLEELEEKNGIIGFGNPKSNIKNIIFVRFRSLMSIMSVLARGVQVPRQDICAHLTKELIQSDGTPFNWQEKMRDILTIYSQEKMPTENVLVKVFFHHHWFYIKASDSISKDTFSALQQLFVLTSSDTASPAMPILTIPVAGNISTPRR